MKFSKGFTLIELLVVIAIIGILSSVVLASLSTARTKGQDAKVQESMTGLRNAAEIFYSTNGAYATSTALANSSCSGLTKINGVSGFFVDDLSNASSTLSSIAATVPAGTCTVVAGANYWALQAQLPSLSSYWCVDSTGKSEKETSAVTLSSTQLCQ